MTPLTYEEKKFLKRALKQDSGRGDLTACIFDGETGAARIMAENDCVLSGMEAMEFLFEWAGAKMNFLDGVRSGSICGKGEVIATAEGPMEALLRVERVALNMISRMSAIATVARKASDIAERASPGARAAGTRKTTPMFSHFEKRALIDGGALPHRLDLSSMAMLKDNHLASLGGGPEAVMFGVEMIRERYGPYVNIEVEVEDIPSGLAAVEAGADMIMLDNFTPEGISKASREIRKHADDLGKQITLEASGGVTLDNLGLYAPHVDVVSMGMLTYGAPAVGFKMEYMEKDQ